MVESSSPSSETETAAEDRRAQFFEEFYSLKQKYEFKNSEMAKLPGQTTMQKKMLPVCVNCGKPGGTLFSIKNGRFLAICRASGKKCSLHMELNRGNYYPTRELLFKYQNILDRAREKIIVMKNNVEFGYGGDGEKDAFEEENAHYESVRKRIEALRTSLGDEEREAQKRDILRELGELRIRYYGATYATHGKGKEKNIVKTKADEEDTIEYIEYYREKIVPLIERLRNIKEPYMIPPYRDGLGGDFPLTIS